MTQSWKWLFLLHFPDVFFSWSLDKFLHLVCSIVKKSPSFPTVVRLPSMLFCNMQTFSAASYTNISSKILKMICCIRRSLIYRKRRRKHYIPLQIFNYHWESLRALIIKRNEKLKSLWIKKVWLLVLDLLFQSVPLCIPSHQSWQVQMEFKSRFIKKLCVICVFILLQLSFRARLECFMFCVPFKHFFFLTSFLISSFGCHSDIPCYLSIKFPTWLEVKGGCFFTPFVLLFS